MHHYAFYQLAEWLYQSKKTPEGFRSAVSRAYYSTLHCGISLLAEMEIYIPSGENKHEKVPDLLEHSGDIDVRKAAQELGDLRGERNRADYQLKDSQAETDNFAKLRLDTASKIIAIFNTIKTSKGTVGGRFAKASVEIKKRSDFLFRGIQSARTNGE